MELTIATNTPLLPEPTMSTYCHQRQSLTHYNCHSIVTQHMKKRKKEKIKGIRKIVVKEIQKEIKKGERREKKGD